MKHLKIPERRTEEVVGRSWIHAKGLEELRNPECRAESGGWMNLRVYDQLDFVFIYLGGRTRKFFENKNIS